jgi:hypothetical protein
MYKLCPLTNATGVERVIVRPNRENSIYFIISRIKSQIFHKQTFLWSGMEWDHMDKSHYDVVEFLLNSFIAGRTVGGLP